MFFFKASQLQQTLVNPEQGFANASLTVLGDYFTCQQFSGSCLWRSVSTGTVAGLGEHGGLVCELKEVLKDSSLGTILDDQLYMLEIS